MEDEQRLVVPFIYVFDHALPLWVVTYPTASGEEWFDSKTTIDESRGEKWFCTEAEAQTAGWRKALNCY